MFWQARTRVFDMLINFHYTWYYFVEESVVSWLHKIHVKIVTEYRFHGMVATVLLQQHCCISTVATILLQQYCCNSTRSGLASGPVRFLVRSVFQSGPVSGLVWLPVRSGFWSGSGFWPPASGLWLLVRSGLASGFRSGFRNKSGKKDNFRQEMHFAPSRGGGGAIY